MILNINYYKIWFIIILGLKCQNTRTLVEKHNDSDFSQGGRHSLHFDRVVTLVSGMQLHTSAEKAESRQKNAARVRKWRETLNPQQLEEERRKDRERQKRRRQRPLTEEAKEHELQLAKERNRRYRSALSTCIMAYMYLNATFSTVTWSPRWPSG